MSKTGNILTISPWLYLYGTINGISTTINLVNITEQLYSDIHQRYEEIPNKLLLLGKSVF